ncbi:hypothetical protein [Nocardioides sp. LHG3406-4]|uniref:hypothetical protein n=1 Tax=Nocardioides sp. LHG3406-4 TaxID=2804575 RepID=UPI003CE6864A
MAWLKRDNGDDSALHGAAARGSYDEFEAVYDPSEAKKDFSGASLLGLALGNGDPAARVAIANRLLDDGADVMAHGDELHVLLGATAHDFEAEPALLRRMLDAGADVNRVVPRFGTPLETLADVFKFSDATLAPFYDVLFDRPDLDLLQQGNFDKSVYANIQQISAKRADLLARADAYLTARGIPIPE